MKKVTFYVDEAWRWPLAWPVTVGVCLPRKRFSTKPFTDSKLLTEKKREIAYTQAEKLRDRSSLFFAVWRSSNNDIDTLWIMPSLQKALCNWLFQTIKAFYNTVRKELLPKNTQTIIEKLLRKRVITPQVIENLLTVEQSAVEFSKIVIDWNHDFWLWKYISIPIKTIIKGDSKVSYIWLASIAAKVERDRYMCSLPKKYSKYWFEKHKWYGTKYHREAIKKYWCSDFHRVSFCKNIW